MEFAAAFHHIDALKNTPNPFTTGTDMRNMWTRLNRCPLGGQVDRCRSR
jgi:hypothetical protein